MTKKAYCLFDNVDITDLAKLETYKQGAVKTVTKYGGKYLVIGGAMRKIEGSQTPNYLVMIEFPSYENANAWYDSKDYEELKALRKSSGIFEGIIFEGL